MAMCEWSWRGWFQRTAHYTYTTNWMPWTYSRVRYASKPVRSQVDG